MKMRLFLSLLFALGSFAPRASALVSIHGREQVGSSGWSERLTAIVNHPARVSGSIGPVGPIARFHYSGDTAVFNEILINYAALGQKPLVIYLQAGRGPAVRGFKADESHDFDLSISRQAEGFLHLYSQGRVRVHELKIPDTVAVEVMPAISVPLDPKERAEFEGEQKRLEEFVARRKTKGIKPDSNFPLKNTR
jgi:hypothetical protein